MKEATEEEKQFFDSWIASQERAQQFIQPLALPPTWYDSPLFSKVPMTERDSGNMHIKFSHFAPGETLPIIGARQAYTRRIKPYGVRLSEEHRIVNLIEGKDGLWMTDKPEELFQMAEAVEAVKPHGKVLIGGLGLGIYARMVSKLKKVKEITVVERSKDVINMVGADTQKYASMYGVKLNIICSDIYSFLLYGHDDPFNVYMLDTWAGTGEMEYWNNVIHLRRAIRNNFGPKPKIHCWAEDIMWGQVGPKLMGPERSWAYEKLPPNMSLRQTREFLQHVGMKRWENKYGKLIPARGDAA